MKSKKVKSIKPVRAWAVFDGEDLLDNPDMPPSPIEYWPMAIYKFKNDGLQAFKKSKRIKVIPVLISPLKARKERKK